MAEYLIQDTTLDAIADAINAKTGGSSAMTPAQMVTEIGSIPSGMTITDGIVIKARDANGYATEIDFYGTKVFPYQFYNRTSGEGAWIHLNTINCKNQISELSTYAFGSCGELLQFDVSHVTEFSGTPFGGSGITELNFAVLETIPIYALQNSGAQTVLLPKIRELGNRALWKMTSLTSCTVGSIGYGVTSINNGSFEGCTNQNLVVTIYTTGAYADTAVANTRNGATNATIVIKASENSTYNGVSYSAGDTMITSEVTP